MHDSMVNHLRGIYGPGLVDSDSFTLSAEIAIYWFANDYHGGQSHPLYEVLSTSRYRPSCLARGIETEGDETAQMMYEDLVCVFNV